MCHLFPKGTLTDGLAVWTWPKNLHCASGAIKWRWSHFSHTLGICKIRVWNRMSCSNTVFWSWDFALLPFPRSNFYLVILNVGTSFTWSKESMTKTTWELLTLDGFRALYCPKNLFLCLAVNFCTETAILCITASDQGWTFGRLS